MLKESQKNNRFGLVRKRLSIALRDMETVGIADTSWKRWEYGGMVPRLASLAPLLGPLEDAGVPDPERVLRGLAGELTECEFRRALGAVIILDGSTSGACLLEQFDRCSGVRGAILASLCQQAILQGMGHLTLGQWLGTRPTP